MSLVVVAGATLECSHGGRITLQGGDPHLDVDGHGAVVLGSEAGLSFASASPPCSNMTTPPPPATPVPAYCQTGAAAAGSARTLAIGTKAVLLATATGPTTPSALPAAPGTWKVADTGQSKLEAS